MSIDEFVKALVIQLPNFAGLVFCVAIEYKLIMSLREDNRRLQIRINELCGDDTSDNNAPKNDAP